jgi:hypothetical protein
MKGRHMHIQRPLSDMPSCRPALSRLTPCLLALGLLVLAAAPSPAQTPQAQPATALEPASMLPDLSGIAWIGDGTFVAVHDSKRGDEDDRPRLGIVQVPDGPTGVTYHPLDVAWPDNDPSHDLESIAGIPGTDRLLLVESGDDGKMAYQRIFLATLTREPDVAVTIDAVIPWPEPIFNVEASAVLALDDSLYFVYAERAEGQPTTELRWAELTVDMTRLTFGRFQSATFAAALQGVGVRPIVGLDADGTGRLYAVTAYDSGEDDGPFRSIVSSIGQLAPAPQGDTRFVPSGMFGDIAQLDGFKVEGVAVVETGSDPSSIYVGTDDENYGATLRLAWPIAA